MIKIFLYVILFLPLISSAQETRVVNNILLLQIEGAIGPATSDYIARNIKNTDSASTSLIVIRIDTPGGLETAMREINKAILAAPVPVVSFVAPEGARAASAGTFILYASHIAAMAPATNLGAATPVPVGPPVSTPADDKMKDVLPQKDPKISKATNDAVAYIRSLAQMRQRNIEWAEKAVSEAASLSAKDALQKGVINLIATDTPALLEKIDGYTLQFNNTNITLDTKSYNIKEKKPDWRSEFLAIITNPNIAYILMLIGIYGLIFELANPGTIISGVIGIISLLLALYAFQVLPVNYAGLALMILGVVMMIGEAFIPSFGALGIGGIIAFVTGSIILMDTEVPGFGISTGLIAATATISSILFLIVVSLAIRARKRPIVTGQEEFVGNTGVAIDQFEHSGRIRFEGEIWNAVSHQPIKQGQNVRVIKVNGLTLEVEPKEEITP